MLGSAMGLAHASPALREAILAAEDLGGVSAADVATERFDAIRRSGFAARTPTGDHPTVSISVPLLDGSRFLAALSMTFFGRAMTINEASRHHVPLIRDVADAICEKAGFSGSKPSGRAHY
jgi:DNA-binding IclR family transcriptional regulator